MLDKKYTKDKEEKWQKFWRDNNLFTFNDDGKPVFSIDTPPPTLSGKMHMGHFFSYSQMDFIARFKKMQGYDVFYPFGIDDNGLPTEKYVEKIIKRNSKSMPREEFRKICEKEIESLEEQFKKDFLKSGLAVDTSTIYRTISDYCQKISQRSFIDIYKMNRTYIKKGPVLWCPKCQTAISQVELEDKEIPSLFNDIKFKIDDEYLVISTTRPELLPSCVCLFVHPDDKRYQEYVGKNAVVPLFEHEVPIKQDQRVDKEKGTGIVMCCTFGDQTDMEWYYAHNLPLKIAITENGKMTELAGEYKGLSIEQARKKILEDLEDNDLIVSQKPIQHTVNVHERCGTPIEFLVTKQWFIKYLDLKKEFLKKGEELNWYPEFMKHRYDNWVNGLQWDWCISRQRYFGVPFPVWYCKKCKEVILADEDQLPVDPITDKPNKKCKCGSEEFIPEQDIMDTWATSSMTPQIYGHWLDNKDLYKKVYPFSLRPMAHDIITFWAFNTIVKSYLHENKAPWENIMISGHALDKNGKKMSKSKGNVVDPMDMIEKYSADALRHWSAGSKLGDDLPFMEKDLITGQKFVTKIWNASKFITMNMDDFKETELTDTDKWLLTKLNKLVDVTTKSFENYNYSKAYQETMKFFWHKFCDNYIEMVKHRMYNKDEYEEWEINSALYTSYNVLLNSLKMIAPVMPHVTEEIYQSFFKEKEQEKSIHLSKWPVVSDVIDEKAEKMGDMAVDIISAVRKYKSENNLSMNTEIEKIIVNKEEKDFSLDIIRTIKKTVKAKEIEFGPASKIKTEDFGINLNIL